MRADARRRLVELCVERDGPGCFYCKVDLMDDEVTLDHYIPLAAGGTWDVENLRIACQPCNNRKSCLVPDGKRHPVPAPRPKKKSRAEKAIVKQMKVACSACMNGRRLDQQMICGQCGRLPLPPHRNHLFRSDMGKCDHARTWCGMCSIFDELRKAPLSA